MTLKQVKELILWLRREKIAYTTLSAGGITIDGVVDTKSEPRVEKPEKRETMYERYGAELLRQPAAKPSEQTPDEALLPE